MIENSLLDVIKRLDVKQNVTIRIIDEPTGEVVQEHVGHNAATHSMLTGIAHYLMGDGVLNQGSDILSMWVPQYISLGTMGLTSQDSETITIDGEDYIVPAGLGSTPPAPESATPEEKELNDILRFEEYINETPGFGADGYDFNTNNNRKWFGLGLPYPIRPAKVVQDFYDGGTTTFTLSNPVLKTAKSEKFLGNGVDTAFTFTTGDAIEIISVYVSGLITTTYQLDINNNQIVFDTAPDNHADILVNYYDSKMNIESITVYPDGVVNEDSRDTSIVRIDIPSNSFSLTSINVIEILDTTPPLAPSGSRVAIIYSVDSKDATNCELIKSSYNSSNVIVPLTRRSDITYRNMVPEYESQLPSTLDIVFSAFVSVGALAEFRGDNDYLYITEAGLWSKNVYDGSQDNGLLAGYRITPIDNEDLVSQATFVGNGVSKEFEFKDIVVSIESVFIDDTLVDKEAYYLDIVHNSIVFSEAPDANSDIVVFYRDSNNQAPWKDMSKEENRHKVQQSILRIGENQVAQVVWKLQLGGLEQLNGLRSIYPAQYPEEVWTIV